jgi:hypothetical protein
VHENSFVWHHSFDEPSIFLVGLVRWPTQRSASDMFDTAVSNEWLFLCSIQLFHLNRTFDRWSFGTRSRDCRTFCIRNQPLWEDFEVRSPWFDAGFFPDIYGFP